MPPEGFRSTPETTKASYCEVRQPGGGGAVAAVCTCSMQGYRTEMEDSYTTVLYLPGRVLSPPDEDGGTAMLSLADAFAGNVAGGEETGSSTGAPVEPPTMFAAVFDGHAGDFTSRWLADYFLDVVLQLARGHGMDADAPILEEEAAKIRRLAVAQGLDDMTPDGSWALSLAESLYSGCRIADAALLRDFETIVASSAREAGIAMGMGGSTMTCCFVTPSYIVVGNVGDSRTVICSEGHAFPLTVDHKPNYPAEHDRIVAAGGSVMWGRILGMLSVSRGFGDNEYKVCVWGDCGRQQQQEARDTPPGAYLRGAGVG